MLLVVFATSLAGTAVMPLLPDLVAQSAPGATTAARQGHIAALAAAGPVGMMLAAPVWGLISDRTRRRPLLLFGLGGFALTLAAMGWPQLEALYASRLLNGLFAGSVTPLAFAIAADRAGSPAERARAFTSLNAVAYAGYLVGPLLGGWVTAGHVSSYYATAATVALSMLVLAVAADPGRSAVIGSADEGRTAGRVPLLIVSAMGAGSLGVLHIALTLRTDARDLSPEGAAWLLSLCGVVMLLAQLVWLRVGWLAARARRLLSPALLMLALMLVANGYARAPWALAAVLAAMAWASATVSLLTSYLISLGPRERLGLNLGAQCAAAAAGQTLAALLTTWEMARAGGAFVWPAAAAAIILAGLLLEFRGRPNRPR
ncbi:MFS transporter [Phenylobacterium sp.]|uniref:MFS transporter n=1 Tax=Phenylobacterium sp. TaxID=1871053 RepID=UPI003BAD9EEA